MRALAFVFLTWFAAPAWADPALRIETAQGAAFTMNTPVAEAIGDRVRVSGSVCRRAFAAGRPRYVRLEHRTAEGDVIAARSVRIRGLPGYRGGCGFYTLVEPTLPEGDFARLSVH